MRGQAAGTDSGAAAVEFALVSVVLLTLLFGIIQFGFYFLQASSVTALAQQAGRAAALREDCAGWAADVAAQAEALTTGASVSSVQVQPTGADRPSTQRGDQETVTVTWDATRVGVVPLPTGPLVERTVVRYERLQPGGTAASCTWTAVADG